ncbi:MAG: gamma-glutamylcyclotransferase family protein [Caldilineaceae bacterium]
MNLNRIFVYGTLCQGYSGHHHLAADLTAPPVEAELTDHRLYNAGHYPLMDSAGPDHVVKGQILTIDPARLDAVLARLDDYEDAHGPNPMYHRVIVLARMLTDPPQPTRAWTYRLNPTHWHVATLPPIPNDDWRGIAHRAD